MTTATTKRTLVTAGDPDTMFPVPPPDWFYDGETQRWHDFLASEQLDEIGNALLSKKLTHLLDGELKIDFRWKRCGGTSKGHAMLGNCVRLSGAARHYAGDAQILVYLAADHLEVEGFTRWQVEALLYHELLKIEREERSKIVKHKDPMTGKTWEEEVDLPTVYHIMMADFSGFYQEVREYGLWQRSLEPLAEVIQPLLPGFDGANA